MNVLYLTIPSYFDLEISLIRELSKYCNVTVLMIVSPSSQHSSAFSLNTLEPSVGIYKSTEYPGMDQYNKLINMKDWFIANNPDNSILSCIRLATKIKSFIKGGHYDIIHMTTKCKTTIFLLPFLRQFPRKLLTVHDPIPHKKISIIEDNFRIRNYYKTFKNLLFLSSSLTNQFQSSYKYKDLKIFYSSLGVYDFLQLYPPIENKFGKYILFFGRIEEYKGVDLLIKGFENSKLCNLGYKLIIAGKGNIPQNDSSDIILINKYIDNNLLSNLIRNCEFVVLPYRSATQSGCVMSAYAFDKPILATKVGDFPNVVKDGETGYLIEPGSPKSITEGLDKMSNANLENFSENINRIYSYDGEKSWISIASDLYNTYQSIINDK